MVVVVVCVGGVPWPDGWVGVGMVGLGLVDGQGLGQLRGWGWTTVQTQGICDEVKKAQCVGKKIGGSWEKRLSWRKSEKRWEDKMYHPR